MIVRNTIGLTTTLVALGAGQAITQVPPAEIPPHADTAVATRSQVTIGSRTIPYTATAGLFPLYVNDTGELMGEIHAYYELPQGLTLEVTTKNGAVLVPYRPEVVDHVNRAAREVVVKSEVGIFD